jgi:hypothetical protein
MQEKKKDDKFGTKEWFTNHKLRSALLAFLVLCIIIGISSSGSNTTPTTSATVTTPDKATTQTQQANNTPAKPAPKVASRQVSGTAVTIGSGTFTGGKDVANGLYDVTPGAGQSGNFMVSGTDSYNDILGGDSSTGGVPKARVQISSGDKIEISSLSQVTFTPVTTPFSTTHTTTNLYSGTFTVGEDVGAGRYIVTPGAGQSGNFMVDGNDSYNAILGGDSSTGGVPNLTVSITNGDKITISSLGQVTFTPSN